MFRLRLGTAVLFTAIFFAAFVHGSWWGTLFAGFMRKDASDTDTLLGHLSEASKWLLAPTSQDSRDASSDSNTSPTVPKETVAVCLKAAKRWERVTAASPAASSAASYDGSSLRAVAAQIWHPCLVSLLIRPENNAVVASALEIDRILRKLRPKYGHRSPGAKRRVPSTKDVNLLRDEIYDLISHILDSSIIRNSIATNSFAESINAIGDSLLHDLDLRGMIRSFLASPPTWWPASGVSNEQNDVPYWRFMPTYVGAAGKAGDPLGTFETACYKDVSVSAEASERSKSVKLIITALGNKSICEDILLFSAAGNIHLDLLLIDQFLHTVELKVKSQSNLDAAWWDVTTNGIHIFKQRGTFTEDLVSGIMTLAWYIGPMVQAHPQLNDMTEMDSNMMLQQNLPIQPPAFEGPMPKPFSVPSNFSMRSGDVLAFTRLDGLDTMFNWAMGSSVAQMAVALCDDDSDDGVGAQSNNNCTICMSIPEAEYWLSGNGVQCLPADQWLSQANKASLHVVHLPLKRDSGFHFNTSSARMTVAENLGIDYGYGNAVFGWMDVPGKNWPCFPNNNFTTDCLSWRHYELLLMFLDTGAAADFANFLGGQALTNRVYPATGASHSGMGIAAAFERASKTFGWTSEELATQPEMDSFKYYSMKNGELGWMPLFSSSAFACTVLRSGGLFSSVSFQCQEMAPWDVMSLQIYETSHQILGNYKMNIGPQANSRSPFTNMSQSCATQGPGYLRDPLC